ncbi:MAG: COG1361 S-layer family protein [Saccharofermentanales bacterium]|nr:hypothetical protein [Bacillota bacterium]
MNRILKKITALMIVATLALTFAMPVFAENGGETSASEKSQATTNTSAPDIPVVDEEPNTDIVVIPSNANALVLMDVGAQSPKGVPGEVVTIVLPVAVNREYLPSERYMLRNITISPKIPNDMSVSNWPFDLINASYTRHLDDMSYNSTAEVYYDFRISEFATKGVYPVNFEVNATVWRYDDVNGTSITEDVTFNLCVYITLMGDGSESGVTTSFGPLQIAAADQSGVSEAPILKPKQNVTLRVPIVNKGGVLTSVTISPVISNSLDEFPFIAENMNYGRYFERWESGGIEYVEYDFTVSYYATSGNKHVKFLATYYENGEPQQCTFSTNVYITNGYVAPIPPIEKVETAMSVMVSGYRLFVNGAEVSGLMAGDDATLRLMLINNAKHDTALKNVATLSLADSNGLTLSVGSSDAAYVSVLGPGETAEVEFNISVKRDAEAGFSTVGVNLTYENSDSIAGKAAQTIMIPVSQPMDIVIDAPVVYGKPTQETPTSMNLNMVNMGRGKALNVRILALDGISMAESYYGGDLLPGGTLSADFQVNCTKIGEFTAKLLVQYEDANGQQYSQEVPVTLNVEEAKPTTSDAAPTGDGTDVDSTDTRKGELPWWAWLLLGLAIVAIVIIAIVSSRNKNKKFKDDYNGDMRRMNGGKRA